MKPDIAETNLLDPGVWVLEPCPDRIFPRQRRQPGRQPHDIIRTQLENAVQISRKFLGQPSVFQQSDGFNLRFAEEWLIFFEIAAIAIGQRVGSFRPAADFLERGWREKCPALSSDVPDAPDRKSCDGWIVRGVWLQKPSTCT